MKIALVRNKYSPGSGGAEKVAEKFVTHFIERGHDITVFSEKFTGVESGKLKWQKVPKGSGLSKTTAFHRQVQGILNKDKLFFLEVNTIPGLSENSIVPKMAKAFGLNYKELITLLIEDALGNN